MGFGTLISNVYSTRTDEYGTVDYFYELEVNSQDLEARTANVTAKLYAKHDKPDYVVEGGIQWTIACDDAEDASESSWIYDSFALSMTVTTDVSYRPDGSASCLVKGYGSSDGKIVFGSDDGGNNHVFRLPRIEPLEGYEEASLVDLRGTEEVQKTDSAKKSWSIIRNLVSKDFKLKYRRSVLGVLWSVLNPLLTMVVMSAIFSTIFRFNVEFYPVYLILGTVLFSMIQESTTTAMTSVIDNDSLIKKVYIDKSVFPIEKVLFALVNFVVSLIAVLIVMLWFKIPFSVTIFMLPILLVYVLVFSLGLGMFLSAVAVYFRDVIHLWGVLCTLWMYLTPIFWPLEALESSGVGFVLKIVECNPAYHFVTYFRDIALYGTMPSLQENLICIGFAVAMFAVGLLVFKKLEKKFILYI